MKDINLSKKQFKKILERKESNESKLNRIKKVFKLCAICGSDVNEHRWNFYKMNTCSVKCTAKKTRCTTS